MRYPDSGSILVGGMNHPHLDQLKRIANQIRWKVIRMSFDGDAPHLGSSLSCVEILTVAYFSFLQIDPKNPSDSRRDRFILSKGHAVTTLYAALALKGFFQKEQLMSFNQDGSSLPEHPSPSCVPGIEMATGSLGHGLSVGAGHALASKILKQDFKVLVLMSDGECNEGSVWEAALFAPAQKLNNLIVVIDFNKWQATARSEEVMQLSPLREKWEAFGWNAFEVDGNNLEELLSVFDKASLNEKPVAIIAHTIKGKGISFMEDDNNWHYRIPNEDELSRAKQELGV